MPELPISPLAAWFHIATDEQLFVETSTTTRVHDGPDQIFLWPFTYKKVAVPLRPAARSASPSGRSTPDYQEPYR